MTNTKLPIAITSCHGSLTIPPELEGRIALTPEQIFNEADAYADDLFDFRDHVLHWVNFPYSRALIDVNRPTNPNLNRPGDGVVKRMTSYSVPVYQNGDAPDAELEHHLISHYWEPWHAKLAEIANDPRVKLVLDVHTMAGTGPATYEDPLAVRPRLMVGNWGNAEGKPPDHRSPTTAPADLTVDLARQMGEAIADLAPFSSVAHVWDVNQPYRGGWNIYAHGGRHQPWVIIELSRGMYIGEQTGDAPIVPADPTRITAIRDRFLEAIENVVSNMKVMNLFW